MALPGQYGAFTPSTQVWDPSQVNSAPIDENVKKILVFMYQNLGQMAQVLNVKDTGQYNNSFESVNGQLWFPNPTLTSASTTTPTQRQVFRKVINFGALPNAATKSIPHGITCTTAVTFTRIYATATNPTSGSFSYIPIPYSSATAAADNLELYVDDTNVNITTGTDYSAYTICYVIVEFIKS